VGRGPAAARAEEGLRGDGGGRSVVTGCAGSGRRAVSVANPDEAHAGGVNKTYNVL
jgi:hypothetical protein